MRNVRSIRILIFICVFVLGIVFLNKLSKKYIGRSRRRLNSFVNEVLVRTENSVEKFKNLDDFEPFDGEKIVHLDLKGAPPMVSYLTEFIPFIRKLGATGLLIEYEDMFPYTKEIEGIKALNSYTIEDIRKILMSAENNNLTVIPFIQTLSHLEFVLKLEEFSDLRENKYSPQELCPSKEKGIILLLQMIDQILKAHPKSKYIHLGCDEGLFMGECRRCKVLSKPRLFARHVQNITTYIAKTYPRVRPIIWGDYVLQLKEELIVSSEINKLTDIMVRNYKDSVKNDLKFSDFKFLAKLFKEIWIASAFKVKLNFSDLLRKNID